MLRAHDWRSIVSKVKKVKIVEGGGRAAFLDALDDSLRNERITAGEYIVVISKVPQEWQINIRPRATRVRGGGRKKGGYQY